MKEIKSTTALHDFPEIYNMNNQELLNRLVKLEKELSSLKSSHSADITKVRNEYYNWQSNLQAEFDQKIDEYEDLLSETWGVKSGNSTVVLSALEKMFVKKDALNEYIKTSDVQKNYITKNDAARSFATSSEIAYEYLSKSDASDMYASKDSLSGYALKSELPEIPTKVSAFTNDAGYLTEQISLTGYAKLSDLPDLSEYVKASELPNYPTKVSDLTNDMGYVMSGELTGYALKSEIPAMTNVPTKVSAFTNDAGYLTGDQLEGYAELSDLTGYVKESYLTGYAKTGTVNGLADRISAIEEYLNNNPGGGDVPDDPTDNPG